MCESRPGDALASLSISALSSSPATVVINDDEAAAATTLLFIRTVSVDVMEDKVVSSGGDGEGSDIGTSGLVKNILSRRRLIHSLFFTYNRNRFIIIE